VATLPRYRLISTQNHQKSNTKKGFLSNIDLNSAVI
jgi:hypothetical protein